MSTVDSVDYLARRIYLSAETVGVPLDLLDVYRDVRSLRVSTPDHRKYRPMIVTGGNVQKTATTFTQPYVQLLYGCHIVPYPADQRLLVVREVFSDDGRYGVECFDRSGVSATVDIDIDMQINPVEVRLVYTAGTPAPTAAENAAAVRANLAAEMLRIIELAKVHGLVPGAPLVVSPTQRQAGDVTQSISEAGGVVTVARAP